MSFQSACRGFFIKPAGYQESEASEKIAGDYFKMRRRLSFVLPCYDVEKTVGQVINDIVATVAGKDDYEIICLDDGSPDNLLTVLAELAQRNDRIKVISLAENIGQHRAIACGMRYVSGDIVVNLDSDGQTDPKQCYTLIDALTDEVDIVFAKYIKKQESFIRVLGSRLNNIVYLLTHNTGNYFELNSYFACRRRVADEIGNYNALYEAVSSRSFIKGKRIKNAVVKHFPRSQGESSYNLLKLMRLFCRVFTASFKAAPSIREEYNIKETINISKEK